MSNLCIVTGSTKNWGTLWTDYCFDRLAKIGNSLRCNTFVETFDAKDINDAKWQKVKVVLEKLDSYKYVWWIDADFIFLDKISKQDIEKWFVAKNKNLVISENWYDKRRFYDIETSRTVNTSSFFCRRNKQTFKLLEDVWNLKSNKTSVTRAFEIVLYRKHKYMPDTSIERYPQNFAKYGFSWNPGDPALHIGGGENKVKGGHIKHFWNALHNIHTTRLIPSKKIYKKIELGKYFIVSPDHELGFVLAKNNNIRKSELDIWVFDTSRLHLYENKKLRYIFDAENDFRCLYSADGKETYTKLIKAG